MVTEGYAFFSNIVTERWLRMTKLSYEWLKDYKELEFEIMRLENNLNRSKRELGRWTTGDLAKYKLTAESDGARLEERIEAIQYELAHKMNDLEDMRKFICSFNDLEYKIVYKKYIEGKTLEKIAEEMNYSSSYIYNKHAQIKRMIEFALNLVTSH